MPTIRELTRYDCPKCGSDSTIFFEKTRFENGWAKDRICCRSCGHTFNRRTRMAEGAQ